MEEFKWWPTHISVYEYTFSTNSEYSAWLKMFWTGVWKIKMKVTIYDQYTFPIKYYSFEDKQNVSVI